MEHWDGSAWAIQKMSGVMGSSFQRGLAPEPIRLCGCRIESGLNALAAVLKRRPLVDRASGPARRAEQLSDRSVMRVHDGLRRLRILPNGIHGDSGIYAASLL